MLSIVSINSHCDYHNDAHNNIIMLKIEPADIFAQWFAAVVCLSVCLSVSFTASQISSVTSVSDKYS